MKRLFLPCFFFILMVPACKKTAEEGLNCSVVDCASVNPYLVIQFFGKFGNLNLIETNDIDTSRVIAWNQNNDTLHNQARSLNNIGSLKNSMLFADWPKPNIASNKTFLKIGENDPIQIDYNYKYTVLGCCGNGVVDKVYVHGYSFSSIPLNNWTTNIRIIRITL